MSGGKLDLVVLLKQPRSHTARNTVAIDSEDLKRCCFVFRMRLRGRVSDHLAWSKIKSSPSRWPAVLRLGKVEHGSNSMSIPPTKMESPIVNNPQKCARQRNKPWILISVVARNLTGRKGIYGDPLSPRGSVVCEGRPSDQFAHVVTIIL